MTKFKVGDKVVLTSKNGATDNGFSIGTVAKITKLDILGMIEIENNRGTHGYVDECQLKKIADKNFILKENDEVDYIDRFGDKSHCKVFSYNGKTIEEFESDGCKVLKVERPTYTTVYEAEEEILDEVERKYLESVIKPFRKRVAGIRKSDYGRKGEYIEIRYYEGGCISSLLFPNFKKGTMYKGMELGKQYTLEELGL